MFNPFPMNRRRRIVAQETTNFLPVLLKKCGNKLINGVLSTKLYYTTKKLKPHCTKMNTKILFYPYDTIDTAIILMRKGLRPCVLNMASVLKPGGGWMKGSSAQEEQLFYRSTYALSLCDPYNIDANRTWSYPLPITGGVYSPDVFVFRNNEIKNYSLLPFEQCMYMDFVAVAALKNPFLENGRLNKVDERVTLDKIRTILRIASENHHNTVLLSAFGCGAYNNPPEHIAQFFKSILSEEEFDGRFAFIVFGIMKTCEKDKNYDVFYKTILGSVTDTSDMDIDI